MHSPAPPSAPQGQNSPIRPQLSWVLPLLLFACRPEAVPPQAPIDEQNAVDLATRETRDFLRVYGSIGRGNWGLPVAAGWDLDGDSFVDSAFGAFTAPRDSLRAAGRVYVVWGNGLLIGTQDTASADSGFLHIVGSGAHEHTGSEIWMDDVTGDGLGDLLIARQNYTYHPGAADERVAAGALTIVPGGPELRELATSGEPLLLDDLESALPTFTLVGANAGDRLSIWMRTGDTTGDGIADLVVGADLEDAGAAYLIAGGPAFATHAVVDLAALDGSPLSGRVAHLLPPLNPSPPRFHFGATCQLGDLDGNGRAEVLVAATLNRAGASLDANGGFDAFGSGGSPRGIVYILWDDHFGELPWPVDFEVRVGATSGGNTTLRGQRGSDAFGEELLAGPDWNGDGAADLYVGDLVADFLGRPNSGSSHIVYDAARLRGLSVAIDELSELTPPIRTSQFYGAGADHLQGDTAASGDINADGIDDLISCSPHASPYGREGAGSLYVLLGGSEGWPVEVDLASEADRETLEIFSVHGARGREPDDDGDTLCYSAAAADLNGDGRLDLAVNEMVGNGASPSTRDAGNLLLLDSSLLLGED